MFMEKKEIRRIAAVTGLTGASLYMVCAVLWLLAPGFVASLLALLVPGLTLNAEFSLDLPKFVGGLLVSFVTGAVIGAFFAYFYGKVEV